MKTYFLKVEDDRTFDVAIQKVLYLHKLNIMHTYEDSIKVSVLYHIHIKYKVRFTAKSQKINKNLDKTLLIPKDVHTDDGQQK